MQIYNYRRFFTLIALFFLASSCTNIDFKEPVSDFGAAMSTSAAILNNYYASLNAAERKVYLTRVKYSTTNERVQEIDKTGQRTGLVYQYSPEWLKAKTDTINLLSAYGSKLAALAGSTAPQRFSSGATVLGSNLFTLDDQIRKISKTEAQKAFANDVETIIGSVGEMYLDTQRDKAIMDAINNGYPAASKALDFLEKDLPIINALEVTGADDSLSAPMEYYNTKLAANPKASLAEKQAVLNEIQANATVYEGISSRNPQAVIVAIRDAINAIVEYANNPGGTDSLVRLNSSMATFNNRVGSIAQATNNIRGY
jgi:hypothetical protein